MNEINFKIIKKNRERGQSELFRMKDSTYAYIMILPALLFFLPFLLIPIFKAVQISFYDYSGIGVMDEFIGLSNYIDSMNDSTFFISIINTLKLMGLDLSIAIPIAFLLAYMLYLRIPGWKFFSVSLYIPNIIPVIVSALIWRFIYEPNFGLLNTVLNGIGLEGLSNTWLSGYDTAFGSATAVWIWKHIPFPMLIFYGAMLRIPEELFEAAKIDGAKSWHIFSKIVIPLMMPVVSVMLVLGIAQNFRSFGMFWILTGGGPGNVTTIASIHVFQQAFNFNNYGYANALAVMIVVIIGGIVSALMYLLRKLGLR